MVEFRIDVVVDPRQAAAGTKRVDRALDTTEKQAFELKVALDKALTARSTGLVTTLSSVNKTLQDTESLARAAAESVETIGAGPDPFQEQLASIRAQTEEIKLRNTAEASIGETLQIEGRLRAQNRSLTAAETKELLTAVSQQRKLNESVRSRAAIQKSLQSVQARTRDLEIQVLKVSNQRKDALREANRLRSEGVKLTALQVNQLEREFGKQRQLTAQIEASSGAQMRLTSGTSAFGTIARRAFAGIGLALVIRQLGRLSDGFLMLQNQLRTIIPDQDELNSTFESLVDIANLTRTEIGSVVQLYQRGSLAANELGASQADLLLFTERVGKALAVQGGSAASSSGALLQLSQALGSGIVRAEEFNSILEGAFPIAQAAARGIDGFGGSVSKLRAAIIKGTITSEVFFRGFLKGSEETAIQFERTSSTIGQAFTVLGNNATVLVGKLSESTGASSLFANSITAIANNLPAVVDAVLILSTALLVRYAGTAIPAALFGTAGLNTALLLSAARFAGVGLAIGAAVGAVVIFSNSIAALQKDLAAIAKTFRDLEDDAAFIPSLGASISGAQREINQLNRAISATLARRSDADVSNLKNRIAELKAGIAAARGEIKATSAVTIAAAKADREAAQAVIAHKEGLERQKKVLEDLARPEMERTQRINDLRALLGRATGDTKLLTDELARLTQERAKAAAPAAAVDPFEQQIESIKQRNQQLELGAQFEGAALKFAQISLALKEKGRLLTLAEVIELGGVLALDQQVLEAEKKRQAVKKLNEGLQVRENELLIRAQNVDSARRDALLIANRLKAQGVTIDEAEISALTEKLQRQRDLNSAIAQERRLENLAAALDVTAQLAQAESDLIELRRQQPALAVEIDEAFKQLQLRQLDASRELEDGFTRAFARIALEAEDLAAVGEQVVSVFADRATDALVEFARTGQFSFKEFANAILDDLIRIIARLLIVQALSAATGGSAGILGSAVNAGAQFGGTVQPGQAPRPVGEAGEELFVPNRTGTIVPNAASVPQEPPVVNVTLVTVQSEDMVAEAIASGSADDVLIQRIGANRDRVNQAQS